MKALHWEGDRAFVALNDDTEEELAYETLSQASDHTLYCLVRKQRLLARVATQAYYHLAERLEEADEGFVLRAKGRTYPIAPR